MGVCPVCRPVMRDDREGAFTDCTIPSERLGELDHQPGRALAESVVNADVHPVLEFEAQAQAVVGEDGRGAECGEGGEYRSGSGLGREAQPPPDVLPQLDLCRNLVAVDESAGVVPSHTAASVAEFFPQSPGGVPAV